MIQTMTDRRKFLLSSLSAGVALNFPAITLGGGIDNTYSADDILHRIAFGSCCKSWEAQTIWEQILQQSPDLFLFLGDTIYADEEEIRNEGLIYAFEKAYQRFSEIKEFQQFRQKLPILATWDDHDYGPRESGVDFPDKESTRKLFLDFWQLPENSKRRTQVGGIYSAYEYGPLKQRVQIILLDTRYGRSPLIEVSKEEFKKKKLKGKGPYLPNENPEARFLDEAQWQWLERQLERPASIRFICSSVPFSAGFRGWESWANFPLERTRLINLLDRTKANGVIFLSGDIHYGDLSCEKKDAPYPLWDLTSSGLTHFWPSPGPNSNRVYDKTVHERNFGLINILWQSDSPVVTLEIRNDEGKHKLRHTIQLQSLRAG